MAKTELIVKKLSLHIGGNLVIKSFKNSLI